MDNNKTEKNDIDFMNEEIKKRINGYVESYICDKGATLQRAIKNIKTGLKKTELNNQDIENILAKVYNENVLPFENSIALPGLFRDRKQRFEQIKNEMLKLLMK